MSKQTVNIKGAVKGDVNIAGKDQTIGKSDNHLPWYMKGIQFIISWFIGWKNG